MFNGYTIEIKYNGDHWTFANSLSIYTHLKQIKLNLKKVNSYTMDKNFCHKTVIHK